MTGLQPVPEQLLWNLDLADFANFAKLTKETTHGKGQTAGQERIQTHGKRKRESCPPVNTHS